MKPLGETNSHVMKVRAMAKAAGADLEAASTSGELTQEEWARIVARCRSCTWDEGCAKFLAQGCREVPVEIPEGCVNRERLAILASDKGENS